MSVRIKVSYTEEEELAGVIRLLSPALKSYKVSRKISAAVADSIACGDAFNVHDPTFQ